MDNGYTIPPNRDFKDWSYEQIQEYMSAAAGMLWETTARLKAKQHHLAAQETDDLKKLRDELETVKEQKAAIEKRIADQEALIYANNPGFKDSISELESRIQRLRQTIGYALAQLDLNGLFATGKTDIRLGIIEWQGEIIEVKVPQIRKAPLTWVVVDPERFIKSMPENEHGTFEVITTIKPDGSKAAWNRRINDKYESGQLPDGVELAPFVLAGELYYTILDQ